MAIAEDCRIGHYIGENELLILPEEVKNQLNITEAFEKRTLAEDANNPIIILPTIFKKHPIVKELIKHVYLVCNAQEFFMNIGSTIDNGVETPTNLFFTIIECKEITEDDLKILYGELDENGNYKLDGSNQPINIGLLGLWNQLHPDMIITKPLHFANRVELEQFKRTL